MIKARIAEENKICLVFDTMQTNNWAQLGKVNGDGIGHVLKLFTAHGIPVHEISAVCLCDAYDKGKAGDYAAKKDYIDSVISTYGFNVLVPVGAEAFTRVVGFKGQSKYLKKSLLSEVYPGQKVIPLQNPMQAKYDPSVLDTLNATVKLIKTECEFPEFREEKKLQTHYTIIDTIEKFDKFLDYYLSAAVPVFSYDTETTSLQFNRGEILTVQFSHRAGFSYLIPCKTEGSYPAAPNPWGEDEWQHILMGMRQLFAEPSKLIIGHNKSYDDKWILHHWGIPLQKGRSFDTMIASFCCDENTSNGLKELACALTDLGDYEDGLERFKSEYCKKNKVLKKQGKDPKKPVFSYGMIPFEILAPYALADTDATIRLYEHFKYELVKEEQEEPFRIMMRISWLMTRFEINGWPIDVPYSEKLKAELETEIEEARQELLNEPLIQRAALILGKAELLKENKKRKTPLVELKTPFVFNLGSGAQKQVLFYDLMKLPVIKRTKKGDQPSTDRESLTVWCRTVPKHKDLLKKIDHYAELVKFYSTYVVGILSKVVNGRVHPRYNPIGAKTGRASSSEPNLMNLPARGDTRKMKLVKRIKRMVAAPEGRILEGADLSAIEMCWAAIVSGDKKLIQIFNDHGLIHESVAKTLFPYITCDLKEVKKLYSFERNNVSKTVQFLSVYGGGPNALSRKVNDSILDRQDMAIAEGREPDSIEEFTEERAKQILADYFLEYSGLDRYLKHTEAFIKLNGYAVSPYGFKRRVPAVNSPDEGIRAQAIRQGCNQTIQNPASIALLLAVANFQEEIDEHGWDVLLCGSLHDANYCDVSEELKLLARDRLLYWMTQPPIPDCPVPIRAEAEWGRTWADFTDDFGSAMVDQEEGEDDDEDDIEEAA